MGRFLFWTKVPDFLRIIRIIEKRIVTTLDGDTLTGLSRLRGRRGWGCREGGEVACPSGVFLNVEFLGGTLEVCTR